ncbi:MAG: T9SS type A sorting domain-containing protein [Candidatus Fermentibacteria bacterium]|nr:T9SS type A sorting domain-containing protein [Candidatus Fermentibacteria bacterium]
MNTFSGKGRVGLLAVFAVLLMPLLGIGTASAIEVNDQVTVLVPDLQEFPAVAPDEMLFTCRDITDHAIWLVQDSSYVDNKGGFADTTFVPKLVWGSDPGENMVDPTSFTALTNAFENDVWGTVTDVCGTPVDLNSDGKVVIVLASMPTKYNSSSSSQASRNNMYYVDPEYNEIEGEAMEVFYLNIHPLTSAEVTIPAAEEMRQYNLANALSILAIQSNNEEEEAWLMNGLGVVLQYRCFGFTQTDVGSHGMYELMKEFRKAPYLELINMTAGNSKYDYCASRGQRFLWLMYLAQREGDSIITTVAQDTENSGMLSIALAINPSADVETAVNDIIVPFYFDWLVCNLHNDFRSDFAGGIYMYDFLAGTTQEDWAHAGMSSAFTSTFLSFPIEGWVASASSAMDGPVWASQYCRFEDYTQDWVTHLNGQYSDGRGANGAINSRWEALVVTCDDVAGEFISVEPLTFDELYNSSFTITDANTYLVITNNNPGGAAGMRYYISNDETVPETETALHQNSIISQYITAYTVLVDSDSLELEGYDWVGPIFEAEHLQTDSVLNMKMTNFYGEVWTGIFTAWASGNYQIAFTGYDSTGHAVEALKEVAVGFADTDLTLEIVNIRLDVPKGGAPSGSMITLAETGTLGLAIESSASIHNVRGRMTGIIAGPVSIPAVTGTLSFASTTNAASVYRYTNEGWVMLDSWLQGGRISATVEEGGIYALGEGIGVFAPEIPAQLVLGANAPNPFSAQTAISFGLPVSGNVRVNVFDMTGRLVTTIANEEMAAANHTIVWDGTDSNGLTVGAGVYFCRLETAGQVLTQKMLKVQ